MVTSVDPSPARGITYFSMDKVMQYSPFCDDFGPFNLGMTHHFCMVIKELLCRQDLRGDKIVYFTSPGQDMMTNAIFLLGAFMVAHLDATAAQAWTPFSRFSPVVRSYRDATWCPSPYNLTLIDCWQGMRKAMQAQLYHPDTFDEDEYFYYDQPTNGDMHEVVKGKFFAFKGPTDQKQSYYTCRPLDYVDIFKCMGIGSVVRLNKVEYDAQQLVRAGFEHHDLFFIDCSTPSDAVVDKFLRLSEETMGAIAVHCLAGLGRTGTLIAMYMMKHMGFTANECIAWLRIVRPGSVIGPQQQYLKDQEQRMWALGEQRVKGLGVASGALAARGSAANAIAALQSERGLQDINHQASSQLADQVTKGMQLRDQARQPPQQPSKSSTTFTTSRRTPSPRRTPTPSSKLRMTATPPSSSPSSRTLLRQITPPSASTLFPSVDKSAFRRGTIVQPKALKSLFQH